MGEIALRAVLIIDNPECNLVHGAAAGIR